MRRPIMIPAIRLWAVLAVFLFAATASAQSPLGGVGTISGKVIDQNGKPVPYASVVLFGTQWGGMSVDDGSFTIINIPAGTYTMKALIIGYTEDQKDGITVIPNQTVTVNFSVSETTLGSLNEVEITAEKEKIDVKSTNTSHDIDSKDLESLPVNEISEAIGLKAGVIAKGGELHFRGGRSGEVNIMVDGVAVKDPLLGAGAAPATLAVEATETIMGGLDAEFGNAQSGVINYTTKEGGREFEGQLYYMTDDYGQPDNTYDNLDRVFLGVGGPSPVRNLTYYISAEGTFSDQYPATPRDRGRTRILNFISIGDRKSNSLRLQSKLAFKPGPNYKLTGEFIFNNTRSETYYHMWSRVGYVQTFRDTTQTGDVAIRHGRWSPTRVDDTYEYYNPANHTPTNINRFNQMKFVWNHTIDESAFYNIKMGRNFFYSDSRVSDKTAWEYLGDRERDFWYDYVERETEPYFVIAGDYPTLSHRETIVYTVKSDFTKKYKNHTIKSGVEALQRHEVLRLTRPYNTNVRGRSEAPECVPSLLQPREGAYYLQDRWEHEGMVLNVGVRYDVFSVGEQLDRQRGRSVKQQISPRVGIAYPISDRDVFSLFHYGRFYQIPDRQYLFDNQDAYDGRVRGNLA
ncbi:MAG: TonB-dependent receptor [Candidatus Eisenbacteria bacterium]